MEEFKIDKEIEKQVESMFVIATQCQEFKNKYPNAWSILKAQFDLADYSSYYNPVSADTFKLRFYAEILQGKEALERKKKEALQKEISKQIKP